MVQLLAPRLPLTSVSEIWSKAEPNIHMAMVCASCERRKWARSVSKGNENTKKLFVSFFYRLLFSVAVATSIIIYLFSSYRRWHLYKFFMRFWAALFSMTSYGLQLTSVDSQRTRPECFGVCVCVCVWFQFNRIFCHYRHPSCTHKHDHLLQRCIEFCPLKVFAESMTFHSNAVKYSALIIFHRNHLLLNSNRLFNLRSVSIHQRLWTKSEVSEMEGPCERRQT